MRRAATVTSASGSELLEKEVTAELSGFGSAPAQASATAIIATENATIQQCGLMRRSCGLIIAQCLLPCFQRSDDVAPWISVRGDQRLAVASHTGISRKCGPRCSCCLVRSAAPR